MTFRSKSGDRSFEELADLVETWNVNFVQVVDNILSIKYFDEFLPRVAAWDEPVELFYEVKSNLKRSQVALLEQAGVHRIQPGIESLSDNVLKLMRKGTTALRNVQLLKWCRERGIFVDWNLLYGFPGETREDYDQTLALLPAIRHLQAPTACAPVRLDRFSPYFSDAAAFGIRDVQPIPPYRLLYPFDRDAVERIAYYFDYRYRPDVDPAGAADPVIPYIEHWIENPERGSLTATSADDGALVLTDTRSVAIQTQVRLVELERRAYEFCDELRTPAQVIRHLRTNREFGDFDVRSVIEFLDSLVANLLMVSDGTHYLGVALTSSMASTWDSPDNVEKPRLVAEQPSHDEGNAAEMPALT